MAIAGNAIPAYYMEVKVSSTTTLRDLCDKPDAAVALILAGKRATVASRDVDAVRRLLANLEVAE